MLIVVAYLLVGCVITGIKLGIESRRSQIEWGVDTEEFVWVLTWPIILSALVLLGIASSIIYWVQGFFFKAPK